MSQIPICDSSLTNPICDYFAVSIWPRLVSIQYNSIGDVKWFDWKQSIIYWAKGKHTGSQKKLVNTEIKAIIGISQIYTSSPVRLSLPGSLEKKLCQHSN